jgi:hypothetical protein
VSLCFWLQAALAFSEPVGHNTADSTIGVWANVIVIFWCFGWPIAFAEPHDRFRRRSFWTLGCAACIAHIALAFHLGHGWSHEAAWEHTREVGGYGDGIFVNCAFALVWLADVVWVWASPSSYFARPRWLHWMVHGFLAFVMLNAAVVFGSWESRLVFVVFFSGAVWRVVRTTNGPSAPEPFVWLRWREMLAKPAISTCG